MSVTYIVYPGYDCGRNESQWLREYADNLDLAAIKAIALANGCPTDDGQGETIDAYIDAYRTRSDLTMVYDDDYQPDSNDDETCFAFRQYASGGGQSRTIKEHLRRAVAIHALTEASKRGINLSVTSH